MDERSARQTRRPAPSRLGLPNLGLGVGLRTVHFPDILRGGPRVDWFEAITENFIGNHGYARYVLRQVADRVPLVLHGVSLSIGSTDPLNLAYLAEVKALAAEFEPVWVSDHLCWTGVQGINSHDLLPLPLTRESLAHVTTRVHAVQDFLDRPLVLENPSTYVSFKASDYSEWEFLAELATRSGCGLLLDVNNVHVAAHNHGFDPETYIRALPHESVVQIHLAGPSDQGDVLIDTHDHPVPDRVWRLYRLAQELTGGVSTLLEWDANIPSYERLLDELDIARRILAGEQPPTRETAVEAVP